jgi:positive regulator of sigma E activity
VLLQVLLLLVLLPLHVLLTLRALASWMFAFASSTHMSSSCLAESSAFWNLQQHTRKQQAHVY